jgi:hypothetical protein
VTAIRRSTALLALGAAVVDIGQPAVRVWIVLADQEGKT